MATKKPSVKRHKWAFHGTNDVPVPARDPLKSMQDLLSPKPDVPGDKIERCEACKLLKRVDQRKFVKQYRNGNHDIRWVDIEMFSRDGETWAEEKTACSVVVPKAASEAQESG